MLYLVLYNFCIILYTHTHTHTHIYIYINICTGIYVLCVCMFMCFTAAAEGSHLCSYVYDELKTDEKKKVKVDLHCFTEAASDPERSLSLYNVVVSLVCSCSSNLYPLLQLPYLCLLKRNQLTYCFHLSSVGGGIFSCLSKSQ